MKVVDQIKFCSEMTERQITAREFFSRVMLDSLEKNFGVNKVIISYFDTKGKFLSWITHDGISVSSNKHPYNKFIANDVIRHNIYQEAVRDKLTYFNTIPRLYKSTDIITNVDYENSAYVRFLQEKFNAQYSLDMAFGINAYIQVTYLKSKDEGDFTEDEIKLLKEIYVHIAHAYKNYKKHEQTKIILDIQNEIISSGENAYLVTDDFTHIMSYNKIAESYLKDILGTSIDEELSTRIPCNWLPFLLGDNDESEDLKLVRVRSIKKYIFKIYTHDQKYSNGIIDRYHWITISKKEESEEKEVLQNPNLNLPLTQIEMKVAQLMYEGLTYKAIANELVVSYHTIKKHVQNIYFKCGIKSRHQLYKCIERRE
ncbi:MAG: response regulator transcription factor [Sarcina sp.]